MVKSTVFSKQKKKLNAQTILLGLEGDILFKLKKEKKWEVPVNMVEQVIAVLASSQDHIRVTTKLQNNHH